PLHPNFAGNGTNSLVFTICMLDADIVGTDERGGVKRVFFQSSVTLREWVSILSYSALSHRVPDCLRPSCCLDGGEKEVMTTTMQGDERGFRELIVDLLLSLPHLQAAETTVPSP